MKEEFYNLMKSQGFVSLRQFARETGIPVGNVYSNLSGRWKLSIERAFIYATTLGVPIDDVLEIFYEKEMLENNKAVIKKAMSDD